MAGYKPVSKEEQLAMIRSGQNPMPQGGWLEEQEAQRGNTIGGQSQGNPPPGGWAGTGGFGPPSLPEALNPRGYVPDWLQNVVGGGLDALGLDSAADYIRPGGGGRATHGGAEGRNPMAFSTPDWMIDSKTFDPADPGQVEKAQKMLNRLGYKDNEGEALQEDAQMGRKTEGAYRKWIEDRKDTRGEDTLKYDYNEGAPRRGMFGRAYDNLDRKMGGYLPGGISRELMGMSAEEFADR